MTVPCKNYIHIEEREHFFSLGYQVANLINELKNKGYLTTFKEKDGKEYGNLALAINTKLSCIRFIIKRINEKLPKLYEEIKEIKDIEFGIAYKFSESLIFELLIDIDSFLFELHSCIELMESYAKKTLRKICNRKISGKEHYIENLLKNLGKDQWMLELEEIRSLFIHGGAPWLGVCMDKEDDYDLLIMKENIHDFSDPEKFIRFSEFNTFWLNFLNLKEILPQRLTEEIKKTFPDLNS